MKAIINFFEHRSILNNDRPIFGSKFVNDSVKTFICLRVRAKVMLIKFDGKERIC